MEVERRNAGGKQKRRRRKRSVLVSANGPSSGVWSKHSSQRISTIRRIERKKREGRREQRKKGRLRSETEKLTEREGDFNKLHDETIEVRPPRVHFRSHTHQWPHSNIVLTYTHTHTHTHTYVGYTCIWLFTACIVTLLAHLDISISLEWFMTLFANFILGNTTSVKGKGPCTRDWMNRKRRSGVSKDYSKTGHSVGWEGVKGHWPGVSRQPKNTQEGHSHPMQDYILNNKSCKWELSKYWSIHWLRQLDAVKGFGPH